MSGKFLGGGGGGGWGRGGVLMGALGIEGAINILLLVCTCHHDVYVSGRELNSVFM